MCDIVETLKKRRRVKVTSDSFIPISTIRDTALYITMILEENNSVVISKQNKLKVRNILNSMYGRTLSKCRKTICINNSSKIKLKRKNKC